MSLPSRERGLKFSVAFLKHNTENVAPFAGAWIEMDDELSEWFKVHVAPFAGAWIEIFRSRWMSCNPWSLPSRERGLKSRMLPHLLSGIAVAPFAGAWIEIIMGTLLDCRNRSLPSRERGLK